MNTTTIIVNGFARAGKDSFVAACKLHLNFDIMVSSFSSIDPVRDLLKRSGIDTSAKTEADRKLLALVGAALEEHSNWRTNSCVDFITDAELDRWHDQKAVVFLHIREPENIQKVIAGIKAKKLGDVHTVLIRGPREVQADNIADKAVLDMRYDDVLHNNSTLDALYVLAGHYLARKGVI